MARAVIDSSPKFVIYLIYCIAYFCPVVSWVKRKKFFANIMDCFIFYCSRTPRKNSYTNSLSWLGEGWGEVAFRGGEARLGQFFAVNIFMPEKSANNKLKYESKLGGFFIYR